MTITCLIPNAVWRIEGDAAHVRARLEALVGCGVRQEREGVYVVWRRP